jgi:hypothetical protein
MTHPTLWNVPLCLLQAEHRLEAALLHMASLQQELAMRGGSAVGEGAGRAGHQATVTDAPTPDPDAPADIKGEDQTSLPPAAMVEAQVADVMHIDGAPGIASPTATTSVLAAEAAQTDAGVKGQGGAVAASEPSTSLPAPPPALAPTSNTGGTPAGDPPAAADVDGAALLSAQAAEPTGSANADDSLDVPSHTSDEVEVAAAALLGPLALHRCWGVATPCNSGAATPSSRSQSPASRRDSGINSSEQGTPPRDVTADQRSSGNAEDKEPAEGGVGRDTSPDDKMCERSVTDSPTSVIPLIACGSPVTGLVRGSGPPVPCLGHHRLEGSPKQGRVSHRSGGSPREDRMGGSSNREGIQPPTSSPMQPSLAAAQGYAENSDAAPAAPAGQESDQAVGCNAGRVSTKGILV